MLGARVGRDFVELLGDSAGLSVYSAEFLIDSAKLGLFSANSLFIPPKLR